MSTDAGTKPEGADPTKATPDSPANPDQGSGANGNGQSAPAGTQSGLSEQEIGEYRAWKESLGKANVTDPRALVEDYTRKAQRAAELEEQLSREREALDVLRGRAAAQEDPVEAAYKAYQDAYYTAEAPALQRRWLELRDQQSAQRLGAQTLQQLELRQKMPRAAEMLGIQDERHLAQTLHSVGTSLTPDELALVALNRKGQLDDYVGKSKKQREDNARRAEALDHFGNVRGAPRIPGSGAESDAIAIPFQEWAAATKEAKARIRGAKEKYVILDAPKHFDINAD